MKLEQGLVTGEAAEPATALAGLVKDQKATWKTWVPSYVGGASLGFFIIGLGTIAGSLVRSAIE